METRFRTHVRGLGLGVGTALALAAACGGEPESATPEGEPAAGEPAPIAGMYAVRGVTVGTRTGDKREISGTVILAEQGDRYTATFHLVTTYPGREEALPAEVIGKGEGSVEGRTLRGRTQTQLVMATVPGVDPGFAFVPRMVGARLVSTSVATIAGDGTVQIQLENRAAPGVEDYAPTRTTLHGSRVAGAPLEALDVATAPPGEDETADDEVP